MDHGAAGACGRVTPSTVSAPLPSPTSRCPVASTCATWAGLVGSAMLINDPVAASAPTGAATTASANATTIVVIWRPVNRRGLSMSPILGAPGAVPPTCQPVHGLRATTLDNAASVAGGADPPP